MPEFPGIIGSRSCTDWDAGIPLDMKSIRDKDEQYWYDHAGTPKGFIRYSTGVMLWGNQFGPATGIRVAAGDDRLGGISNSAQQAQGTELVDQLRALTSIGTYGFTITDLRGDGLKAATSGVDFSTLFLSLSFFIIISALVLLIMAMDNHLRAREGEIAAYTALGFRKKGFGNCSSANLFCRLPSAQLQAQRSESCLTF
ncbi:MAG: hypothetical protein MZV63_62870 [Marinilabiliales bacterium]|nr:hypothetical protein [Marinilabiliales bacterium]